GLRQAIRDRVHLGLRRVAGLPRAQPPDGGERNRAALVEERVRRTGEWYPDVAAAGGKVIGGRGQHADDLRAVGPDVDRAADDARVSAESPAPEPVGQQGNRRGAVREVGRGETPAGGRPEIEQPREFAAGRE